MSQAEKKHDSNTNQRNTNYQPKKSRQQMKIEAH